jgi:hypothetical protein
MESTFGENMPDTHTSATAVPDMFLLARTLFAENLAEPRDLTQITGLQLFDSHDILRTGMDLLEEKVIQFNQQHVRLPSSLNTFYPSAGLDDIDEFADISEYATVLGEGLDAATDPTFDATFVESRPVTTTM